MLSLQAQYVTMSNPTVIIVTLKNVNSFIDVSQLHYTHNTVLNYSGHHIH